MENVTAIPMEVVILTPNNLLEESKFLRNNAAEDFFRFSAGKKGDTEVHGSDSGFSADLQIVEAKINPSDVGFMNSDHANHSMLKVEPRNEYFEMGNDPLYVPRNTDTNIRREILKVNANVIPVACSSACEKLFPNQKELVRSENNENGSKLSYDVTFDDWKIKNEELDIKDEALKKGTGYEEIFPDKPFVKIENCEVSNEPEEVNGVLFEDWNIKNEEADMEVEDLKDDTRVPSAFDTCMMLPQYDPVCVLLETPFSTWTKEDQKEFLNCERPRPALRVNKNTTVKGKVYVRNFKELWYSRHEWLCGSRYLNKLFCLPCLAISTKSGVWNKDGFSDFGNVNRAFHKHECSTEHMRCSLALNRLSTNTSTIKDALKENTRLHIKKFNEKVQLNRRFMELPIRAAIYLGKQELAFRGHDEDESSVNRGNFEELLDSYIQISSLEIKEHYEKIKPAFSGASKTIQIQNELIDSIAQYIDDHIDKEIKDCDFFSVQVDDTTYITRTSQCSIIIRFVNCNGKLVERFLGFHYVSSSRTAESLYNVLIACLEKYDYKSKLVGQCYDGASVVAGQLNALQSKVKEAAPQAVFVHCLGHQLNLVLQRSCSGISKCRIFFANISGLPAFFHHSAKRADVVDTAIPQALATRWSSDSNIYNVINNEWDSLKQYFSDIIDDPNSDQTSVRQSVGFLNNFNDFEFALLVLIFSDIFSLTDVLFNVLQKKSLDINYCISQIKNSQTLLNAKRNYESFKQIYDLAVLRTTIPTEQSGRRARITSTQIQVFEKFKVLYYEILDTISVQITTRFQDLEKIQFVALMDTSKFNTYSKNFPTYALHNLKDCYPNIFADFQKLNSELQFIYSNKEFRDSDPQTFMTNITENKNIFREAYKLFSLIMTIPSTSVFVEQNFFCLNRVKTYLRSSTTENGLNFSILSKISIEKELLNELMETQPFYDDIIDKFAGLKDRRIDLVYKKQYT